MILQKKTVITVLAVMLFTSIAAQTDRYSNFRTSIPRDSILLSDPCILADRATGTYYMTGTGGLMWTSRDLDTWDGPYIVAHPDPHSWTGANPQIWAAEIHPYKGKYYYFATFTNDSVMIGRFKGMDIPRRSTQVLVSDSPGGPSTVYPVDIVG